MPRRRGFVRGGVEAYTCSSCLSPIMQHETYWRDYDEPTSGGSPNGSGRLYCNHCGGLVNAERASVPVDYSRNRNGRPQFETSKE